MRKRLLMFVLILCLTLFYGWQGSAFPFSGEHAGGLCYRSEQKACSGLIGDSTAERQMVFRSDEALSEQGMDAEVLPAVFGAETSCCKTVSDLQNRTVIVREDGNDQLDLVAIMPRA